MNELDKLKQALSATIAAFNTNRAAILELANTNGGQAAIIKIEHEYDTLRDAYFELLRKELDSNNHLYDKLISLANSETEKLQKSVRELNNIHAIIDLTTSVINLIGRILIVTAM